MSNPVLNLCPGPTSICQAGKPDMRKASLARTSIPALAGGAVCPVTLRSRPPEVLRAEKPGAVMTRERSTFTTPRCATGSRRRACILRPLKRCRSPRCWNALGRRFISKAGWPGANPTDKRLFDEHPRHAAILHPFGMGQAGRARSVGQDDVRAGPWMNAGTQASVWWGKPH